MTKKQTKTEIYNTFMQRLAAHAYPNRAAARRVIYKMHESDHAECLKCLDQLYPTKADRGKKGVPPVAPKDASPTTAELPAQAVTGEQHVFSYTKYKEGLPVESMLIRGPRREDALIELAQKAMFRWLAKEPPDVTVQLPADSGVEDSKPAPLGLWATSLKAPAEHHPAALIFYDFFPTEVRSAWGGEQAMTALTHMMYLVHMNTYGSIPPRMNEYGTVTGRNPDGSKVLLHHAHYDVKTVWGTLLVAMHKLRYHHSAALFRGVNIRELTPFGGHLRDTFIERSRLPRDNPGYVPTHSDYIGIVRRMHKKNGVL